MAGLMFLMEFNDWTCDAAVEAYLFRMDVHYALNLGCCAQSMTTRTVERYRRVFREDGLAQNVMDAVTAKLVQLLEQDVEKQRLDSTHVFSNMARFGRSQLMATTVRRFLHQLKRHESSAYDALPEKLRERYAKNEMRLFGDAKKKGKQGPQRLRQQIAEDMLVLIATFEDEAGIANRTTFKNLVRVFNEQCEVVQGATRLRKEVDSRVMQNPSDPDATYDGHKGSGYQVQLAETCSEDNEVQLITEVLPQTAADSDSESVEPITKRLDEAGCKPKQMLADTAYGSDDNVRACQEQGIELITPVRERNKGRGDKFSALDFDIDPETQCVRQCPAGHAPRSATYNPKDEKGSATFSGSACRACVQRTRCCVYKQGRHYRLIYRGSQLRIEARRRHQKTDVFRKTYAKRAGIEGTNSALKRNIGFGHLRVRGAPAVTMAILLRTAGYNLRQASRTGKARAQVTAALGQSCHAIVQMLLKCSFSRLLRLAASRIGPLFRNTTTLAPPRGFALSTIT